MIFCSVSLNYNFPNLFNFSQNNIKRKKLIQYISDKTSKLTPPHPAYYDETVKCVKLKNTY